ncbi:QueT transporter family protein [Acetobacterium paludosum]|uniref:QueT transporter family protein n=1 Tax=Acetobacterium paludosum TaxID=52693 RepID=A0A923KPE5_9FIRM|nr:QueT transporter family protein [Acetobacterium paludosum]MBC3888064.1 QueT transporter family protein [Acetobacterium paludosum]
MQNKESIAVKKQPLFYTKKITISGVVIAIYIVIMLLTQSFAFGQYQVRVATSLYALAAIQPFLIIPLGVANLLSNTIMGGLGPLDMIGGCVAGLLTATACYYIKKINVILVGLPIFVIPTLLVPIWLSYILGVPYLVLLVSVGIGQILPSILGVLIVKYLEKPLLKI